MSALPRLVAEAAIRPEAKYWTHDPLFSAPVVLCAQHLNALPAAEAAPNGDVCWLNNHPIRYVDVAGLIIGVDPKKPHSLDRRVSITLDDGTGLIECVHFRREDDDDSYWRGALECYQHGRYMHVHGKLGRWRNARQLNVQRMWADDDPQAECLHWLKAARLWHECYKKTFRIPGNLRDWERQERQEKEQQEAEARAHAVAGASTSTAGATSAASLALRKQILSVLQGPRGRSADAGLNAQDILRELPSSTIACSRGEAVAQIKEALRLLEEELGSVYSSGDGGWDPRYRAVD